MAPAQDVPSSTRAGASFTLTELQQEHGKLVVVGHWDGVRGLRFVRPTLLLGSGRELLATLADKPWAPDADPWRAAFAWDGDAVDVNELALAVAPSVIVPLTPGGKVPDAARADAAVARPVRPSGEPPPASASVPAPAPARPAAPAPERERAPAPPAPERERAPAPTTAAVEPRSEWAVEDARRRVVAAERERDQLLSQRKEAVRDRDAALRTRGRMEAERDTAVAERAAATSANEGALAHATGERDDALRQGARVRAQRDEALVAHRALQRRVDGLMAHGNAVPSEPREGAAAALEPDEPRDDMAERADIPERREIPDGPDEAPIGVRAVPAAATLAVDLHRAERPRRSPGAFDLWALRVVGAVTGICFLVLLVLLLSVFL